MLNAVKPKTYLNGKNDLLVIRHISKPRIVRAIALLINADIFNVANLIL